MAWAFVGVSNVVEVITTSHALVTTGIVGLQAGDLLVACIASRIASAVPITLPTGGAWTKGAELNINSVGTTGAALSTGMMAFAIRGASDPNLTFTHPTAPSVALGRIVAYRNFTATSPLDATTGFSAPASTTAVSGAGLTTTQADDLIVAVAAGAQEAAWSSFAATSPSGASGATVTTAPSTTTWSERADSITTTGGDTSLGIFDAVKATAGATGNLTVTASVGAGHTVVASAFRIMDAAATVTGAQATLAATQSAIGDIDIQVSAAQTTLAATQTGAIQTLAARAVAGAQATLAATQSAIGDIDVRVSAAQTTLAATQTGTISVAALSKTWVKQAGTWKQATVSVKHAGTWKAATPYVKQGGVWKRA